MEMQRGKKKELPKRSRYYQGSIDLDLISAGEPYSALRKTFVKGTVYNVEMQRGKKKELPKRSRYYQGSIDLDLISAGEPYSALRKTFVIFICTFDPFLDSRHIYTFENVCRENPSLLLGDETTKLFLNTRGTLNDIDSDMREFLTYIEHTTKDFASQANNPLVKDLQQGLEQGYQQATAWTTDILKLYVKGVPTDIIASRLQLDMDYVAQVIHNFEAE